MSTAIDHLPELRADYHYASVFVPRAQQASVRTVFLLWQTLEKTATACTDPGVARLKIQWWQQELSKLSGTTELQHPLSRQLRQLGLTDTIIEKLGHLPLYFDSILQPGTIANVTQLQQLIDAGPSNLFTIMHLLQTDAARADYSQAVVKLATASTLCQAVLTIGEKPFHGTRLVPFDLVQKHDCDLDAAAEPFEPYVSLFDDVLSLARTYQSAAVQLMPPRSLQPAAALTQQRIATLAEAKRSGYPLYREQIHLTPLNMLWQSWKTRRKMGLNKNALRV